MATNAGPAKSGGSNTKQTFYYLLYTAKKLKTQKSIDKSTEYTAVIESSPITKKLSGQRSMTMTQ